VTNPEPSSAPQPQETKDKTDHRLAALTVFKDFTNYLLVTTVAATGWVVMQRTAPALWRAACAVLSLYRQYLESSRWHSFPSCGTGPRSPKLVDL